MNHIKYFLLRYIFLSMVALTFMACNNNKYKRPENSGTIYTGDTTNNDGLSLDTVWLVKDGYFYVFYLNDTNLQKKHKVELENKSQLFWGTSHSHYHSKDTLVQYILERCRLKRVQDSVIVLESASGNGLFTTLELLLPLNNHQMFKMVYCPLEYYFNQNLIVYSGFDPSSFIVVENIVTGKKFIIKEERVCSNTDFYNSFSKLKIIKNQIYYEWYSGKDCDSKLLKKHSVLPDYIF